MRHAGLERLLDVHQPLIAGFVALVGFLVGEHAPIGQQRRVLLSHCRKGADALIHLRLGVCGFVALVVPVAAVPHQVDQHIFAEPLPIGHRESHGGQTGLRVVRIDVDDRDVEPLGKIAGVSGRARVDHVGGEADLVVGDEMDRPAGPIALEGAQIQRFAHHALSRECRVAVDNHRERAARIVMRLASLAVGLLGPCPAVHYCADKLQVARIWRQSNSQDLPAPGLV